MDHDDYSSGRGRKRSRNDDDYGSSQGQQSRGYKRQNYGGSGSYHGGSGRSGPRSHSRYSRPPPPPPPLLLKVRTLIARVAEDSKYPVSASVGYLGKNIVDLAESERLPAFDTMQATILEQPHKAPLLSCAIQVANSINSAIGKIAIESFHMRLQNAVNDSDWALTKALTRFLVCLYPIISEGESTPQEEEQDAEESPKKSDPSQSGAIKLLNTLLDRAIAMQTLKGSVRCPLAEEFYATAVLAIPYLCSSIILNVSPPETKATIVQLIEKSREFIELYRKTKSVVDRAIIYPFVDHPTTDEDASDADEKAPYTPPLYIHAIAEAIDRFEENGLETRSFIHLPRLIELDISKDTPIVRHSFPAVHFSEPESLILSPYYGVYGGPAPRLFLTCYLPNRGLETVPPPTTIEAVVFREIAQEIINFMDFNPNEVAHQLLTFDWYASKTAFTTPGIPIENLLSLHETAPSASTWKSEDLCMDAVLDILMKLPGNFTEYDQILTNDNLQQNADGSVTVMRRNSPLSLCNVYMHIIIIKMCKFSSQTVANVLGRAIRFLYDNIGTLDVELNHRIIDWFSHHLSNFLFTWTWHEWMYYIHLPDLHPKKVFIQQLILKEVRLSNVERVRVTLPVDVARRCLPEVLQAPTSKWLLESSPCAEEMARFRELLTTGGNTANTGADGADDESGESGRDAISTVLQELREKAASFADDTDPTSAFVDMVVSTVCDLGSRSLTHVELLIVQLKDMLVDVCSLDPTAAIESILEYWIEQAHIGLLVMQIFIRKGIIAPKPFIQLLFDYKRGDGEEYNADEAEDKEELKLQQQLQEIAQRAESLNGAPYEETEEDRETRQRALALTKRKNRRNLWPHWRLLATAHGWETLTSVLEFAQEAPPARSGLAQSERDELLIDLLTHFARLINEMDEDARVATELAEASDKAAAEQKEEAERSGRGQDDGDINSEVAADGEDVVIEDEGDIVDDRNGGDRSDGEDSRSRRRRRDSYENSYAYRNRYSDDEDDRSRYRDSHESGSRRRRGASPEGEGAPAGYDAYYASQWEDSGAPYRHIKTEQLARSKESRDAESKRWALWWARGVVKALVRRYFTWFSREEVAQGSVAAIKGVMHDGADAGSIVLKYLEEVSAI